MKCEINDISIYYEEYGEGIPVLMIHGCGIDHRFMTGCMEPIFRGLPWYRRIYVDLPGMGKTKGIEKLASSDKILELLLKFIDKVIPNEKFLLAGQSYGGYLSRGIIYRIPDRVLGLALINPVIIADKKKRNVPDHKVIKKDERFLKTLSKEEYNCFNDGAVIETEEVYKRFKEEILVGINSGDKEFLEKLQGQAYSFSFDVDDLNEKFTKPVLILTGKQDSCVGYKDAYKILDNYPRATYIALDAAGHNLTIEQPQMFNSLILSWLNSVSQKEEK